MGTRRALAGRAASILRRAVGRQRMATVGQTGYCKGSKPTATACYMTSCWSIARMLRKHCEGGECQARWPPEEISLEGRAVGSRCATRDAALRILSNTAPGPPLLDNRRPLVSRFYPVQPQVIGGPAGGREPGLICSQSAASLRFLEACARPVPGTYTTTHETPSFPPNRTAGVLDWECHAYASATSSSSCQNSVMTPHGYERTSHGAPTCDCT